MGNVLNLNIFVMLFQIELHKYQEEGKHFEGISIHDRGNAYNTIANNTK